MEGPGWADKGVCERPDSVSAWWAYPYLAMRKQLNLQPTQRFTAYLNNGVSVKRQRRQSNGAIGVLKGWLEEGWL
jgi:hypothetical protein